MWVVSDRVAAQGKSHRDAVLAAGAVGGHVSAVGVFPCGLHAEQRAAERVLRRHRRHPKRSSLARCVEWLDLEGCVRNSLLNNASRIAWRGAFETPLDHTDHLRYITLCHGGSHIRRSLGPLSRR